jgi:peptide/nickel transport system ATP-binding protein
MQLIFQDPYSSLNPKIRIGEAISEAMLVHGLQGNSSMSKKRTLELLEEVGLKPEWYDRYPHEFSGGQRQRIVIARALAVEPEFLICDESVAALDVSVQAQVLNLLQDLKSRYGLSMIFISHDLSVIAHMSNRIAVMYGGQIEESGPTEAIVSHPKSAYTLRLIKAIPEL